MLLGVESIHLSAKSAEESSQLPRGFCLPQKGVCDAHRQALH